MILFNKILDAFKLESTKEIERTKELSYDGTPKMLLDETNALFRTIKTTTNHEIFEKSLAELKINLRLLSKYEKDYDFPKGVPSKSLENLEKNEKKIRRNFQKRAQKAKARAPTEILIEEPIQISSEPKKEKNNQREEKTDNIQYSKTEKKNSRISASRTLAYAAMCEKHAQERDYMEKLGILEDYEDE